MRIRVFALVVGVVTLLCAACAPGAAGTSGSVNPDQLTAGGEVYANRCTFCHGADGLGGDRGPAHAGNPELAYASYVADRILHGYGYKKMPAYGGRLSDEEIANVATYIRNSWGNNFGPVSAAQVAARR
jgi:mono/diheme cytochrome c family protein